MRKYTLLISVVVHAAAVFALFVAPLLAAGVLPSIHERTSWMPVRVAPPPAFGDSSSRRRAARAATTATAPAPPIVTAAPPSIEPEAEAPAPAPTVSAGGPGGSPDGDPGGGLGPGIPTGLPGGDPIELLVAPPPPAPSSRTIVRPGGRISAPRKVVHVPPVYPPLAMRTGVQGDVIVEALIAEDGSVQNVKVLRSVPLLDQAAMDAVRRWRFTASTLNDQPIAVLMTVTVRFELR